MVHLTEKPVELAARALQYSSKPGENVLDLFGGSGSTLMACEQLGRRAFLMELDPAYCDVIVQRWENATGQKAKREGVKRRAQGAEDGSGDAISPPRTPTPTRPSARALRGGEPARGEAGARGPSRLLADRPHASRSPAPLRWAQARTLLDADEEARPPRQLAGGHAPGRA